MVGQQLLHHFSTKAEGLEDVLNEHGLKKTPTFSPVTSKLPPDLRKFELKRNFSSSLAENAFLGITNIYWGCQTGNLYPMLQQSVQHTQTPYTSNLNWQNTAVVSIHGASSKTTNLWKRKKKKIKVYPHLCFLANDAKKQHFCVSVCFSSLAQTSQERKWFIKHLKTPLLLVSSHRGRTCTYTQCVGFSLEPANEALQPVQNGARTRSHTLFGEYMDIKENTTHEAYHRKKARL